MKLRKFTKRKSPATGKPYPQCQHVSNHKQCEKPAYSDGLCWKHYRLDAPRIPRGYLVIPIELVGSSKRSG